MSDPAGWPDAGKPGVLDDASRRGRASRQKGKGAAVVLWNGKHGNDYEDVWGEVAAGDDYLKDMCRALFVAAIRVLKKDRP